MLRARWLVVPVLVWLSASSVALPRPQDDGRTVIDNERGGYYM
jgi:hypothetical protein